MSDHSKALVPLEAWAYASPELKALGRNIDVGLFAEALIYYDVLELNPGNPVMFAAFLHWLQTQRALDDFLALCKDGTIRIYDYSFLTMAILTDGVYTLYNIQDAIQEQPNSFGQRFLYRGGIDALLPKARHRKHLYKALTGNVTEAKAAQFSAAIDNARRDFRNADRNALVLQAFLDRLFEFRAQGTPPYISAGVSTTPQGHDLITYNINLAEVSETAGPEIGFHLGTPLVGSGVSNRLLWSAASLDCDLYLPRPMSILVGDKLYESSRKLIRPAGIMFDLQQRVDFPDIRQLVNDGKLGLTEVLLIRKKAKRRLEWHVPDRSEWNGRSPKPRAPETVT